MKNGSKKFLSYIPGYRSGKNKKIATIYYLIILALILMQFIMLEKADIADISGCMIFLLMPFLLVGVKKIFKGTKEEKLIYFVCPFISIIALVSIINLYFDNDSMVMNKAIKTLNITNEEYDYQLKAYRDENTKLVDNKKIINSTEYTYDELCEKYNSLKKEYSDLKIENDRKLALYNDLKAEKAKKEQEKLALAKAEKERELAEKEAKKKENKTNNASDNNVSNSGNFKVNDGIANHDSRSGYNSPTKDPNRPVITSEYGYIAEGNSYIHKTANCKFIREKNAQRVSTSSSGKHACNCWRY